MVSRLIERIASCVEDEGIPYMIMGGQAVLLYGEPRLTRDIDITLGVGLEGLPRVLMVVEKAGMEVLADDPEDFASKTMVVPARDPETGLRVDFILSHSEYEKMALSRTRAVRVGRKAVRFISPEDLVIHKIIAGRPRDLEDARIVIIRNPDIDRKYILRWLEEFEKAMGEGFMEVFKKIL